MRVVLQASCSECYQVSDLVVTEKTREIICPTCGHSVPPLEEGAMSALAKDQKKRLIMTVAAGAAFVLAGVFFLVFIKKAGGGPPAALAQLPGDAVAMMAVAIVMLLVALGVGFVAASRSYVCEF